MQGYGVIHGPMNNLPMNIPPKKLWFSLPQYQSTASSSSVKSGVSWASPLKPGLVLCISHSGNFSSCEFMSPCYIQKITFCNALSPSSGLNFLLFSLLRYSLSPGMYLPARISSLQNVHEAYKSRLAHWFITHDKYVYICVPLCVCVCARMCTCMRIWVVLQWQQYT